MLNKPAKFSDLLTLDLEAVDKEFDKLWGSFFQKAQTKVGFPKYELTAREDGLHVQFALAGYPKDKLSVEVSDNYLTVRGDKVEGDDNLLAGRAFTKTFHVHSQYDLSSTTSKYQDGLLSVHVPLKEQQETSSITIQ